MFRVSKSRILGFGFAVVGGLSLFASPAAAQATTGTSGPYAMAGAGFTHRQQSSEDASTFTDFENGYDVNVAGGYKVGMVAVEGEYSYFRNSSKTTASVVTGPQPGVGNVSLKAFMANVRFESPSSVSVGGYVGAGIGGYKSYLNGLSNTVAQSFGFVADGSNDGVVLAFQLRAGVLFHLAPRVAVLAGYRYFHGGDLTFLGTAFGDLHPSGARIHSGEAAVKIGF